MLVEVTQVVVGGVHAATRREEVAPIEDTRLVRDGQLESRRHDIRDVPGVRVRNVHEEPAGGEGCVAISRLRRVHGTRSGEVNMRRTGTGLWRNVRPRSRRTLAEC